MTTNQTTDTALQAHTETDHQVWVQTPTGGLYLYRDSLIYSVALTWARQWNENTASDVPLGSTFIAVKATTTFTTI